MGKEVLNLNVGILGHVDSGKTSLAEAISTVASTAAFDKNPQSQERGITIDLGFSSFQVDMPSHLRKFTDKGILQFTLVDCPGHASLIRTIIGGAQIIDMMILVVDIIKGMQTQTAECLIIGEITCKHMVVVLNKIDLLPSEKRGQMIEKMTKKMKNTLANTVFKDAPVVSISAKSGENSDLNSSSIGIEQLIETLKQCAYVPIRGTSEPFLFAVDHCFSIRGQGTVMTGTVLQGCVNVNDTIEIPSMQVTKKVKTMQMFHQPVEQASQGDRVGICVTQFDPKLLERGLVCCPGYITNIHAAIISAQKIRYFKSSVKSKMKFHISVGYETVMAKVSIFGLMESDKCCEKSVDGDNVFSYDQIYKFQDELLSDESDSTKQTEKELPLKQYVLLEFEKPILASSGSIIIGSKLDIDINSNSCRIAFWGKMLERIVDKNYSTVVLPKLKVYKDKCKTGSIDRIKNENEVIGKDIFKKETNIQLFVGLKVNLSTGEEGVIDGAFGQSGKVNIRIPGGLKDTTVSQINLSSKKKGKNVAAQDDGNDTGPVKFTVAFKRYAYDPEKRMIQL